MADKKTSYLDLISPTTDEEKGAAKRKKQAEAAALNMDGAINSAKKVVVSAEQAVEEVKTRIPFDPQALVDAVRNKDEVSKDLEVLLEQKKVLFP